MNISPEKMTFLTANYGLTPKQVTDFYEGYCSAYQSMAAEIEYAWHEGGWYPDDEYAAMVECLCDADRLEQFIPNYMDWCFDFVSKMELVYDIEDKKQLDYNQKYLESTGRTSWWQLQNAS